MQPVIKYAPHLFLAVELDAEWSRARAFGASNLDIDPLAIVGTRLAEVCSTYRSNIEFFSRAFDGSPDEVPSKQDAVLFQPILSLPTGHADAMAFVLVDDFDSIHHIGTHAGVTEEMVLAFCPEVESLGLHNSSYVVDVERHWDRGRFGMSMLSRFKLDGVCNLEYGLLFKRAIFRALATRVDNCVSEFRRIPEKHFAAECFPEFAVTFLCLQGQEEIGVLCSTTDVTLAAALSSAVRSLTMSELFSADRPDECTDLLRKHLFGSVALRQGSNQYTPGDLHRTLFNAGTVPGPDYVVPEVPIFRWSKSVVCFHLEVGAKSVKLKGNVSGLVSLDLDFQHIPGVPVNLKKLLLGSGAQPPLEMAPEAWRHVQLGLYDSHSTINTTRGCAIASKAAETILRIMRAVVQGNIVGGRLGVIGMKSTLSVPIPDQWPFSVRVETRESPLDSRLYAVRHHLQASRIASGFFSFESLVKAPRTYGLPRALRRSIELLFRNFCSAMVNPNLYDLVIDLYDAFATFHRVLTEIVPALQSTLNGRIAAIGSNETFQLSAFATSLSKALERRLLLAYPDSTVRNVSLQFPGSLVQILFSVDAPLKAALGVLKYHLPLKATLSSEINALRSLDEVGVVASITLDPGIRAVTTSWDMRRSPLGIRNARLAFMALDVDHLFYVGSLFDYLHEAFHFVFGELVMRSHGSFVMELAEAIRDDTESTVECVEEIFVQLACVLYIAPDRPIELLYYLVGKFALDVRSAQKDLVVSVNLFSEQLVRVLLPCWLVVRHLASREPFVNAHMALDDIIEFASNHMERLFHLMPELANLNPAETSAIRTVCLDHFRVVWNDSQLAYYLPRVWAMGLEFYEKLCEDHKGFAVPERRDHDISLQRLKGGWGVTRHDVKCENYIDSVAATALILGQYLTRHGINFHTDLRMQLDRDSCTGEIHVSSNKYATFLIDRGSAQRFCTSLEARGKRLRNQIAIFESFWDASSHFRARRVMDLLRRFQQA